MGSSEEVVAIQRPRHFRSVAEKRQIVEQTLLAGASVAEVARAYGVNANQVFKWRRAFERGELVERCALLPVTVSAPTDEINHQSKEEPSPSGGAIHIELPGRAMISVERGADMNLVRYVLESLSR
jgi:transposase